MSARTQDDTKLKLSRGNTLSVKWESRNSNGYPEGMLKVMGCEIGEHFIAKYKAQTNRFWVVRPTFSSKEDFKGDMLQFLVVPKDNVCWLPTTNGNVPTSKVLIVGEEPGEQNKFIGKHKKHGVGAVERVNGTLTFFHGENHIEVSPDDNCDILCENVPKTM